MNYENMNTKKGKTYPELKKVYKGKSIPRDGTEIIGDWHLVADTVKPPYNIYAENVREIASVDYVQTWEVYDLTQTEIDANIVLQAKEKQNVIEKSVQMILDTQAKAKGYDSILSACSYSGHTNPFQAEGQSFVTWRGLVWEHCYKVLVDVQDGIAPEPTIEELIASLPTLNLGA